MSIASPPSPSPSAAPSGPNRTASTSGESTTIVMAMPAAAAACGRRVGDDRAVRGGELLGACTGPVPRVHLEAGAAEVRGHPRAHDPEPQERHLLRPLHVHLLPGSRFAACLRRAGYPPPSAAARRRSAGCVPACPGAPPSAPGRGVPAALGDQRVVHRLERLELAHDAVAAARGAPRRPSRAAPRTRPRAAGTRARAPRPAC